MYGLYITGRNKGNKADGVEKKIQSQIAAFEKKILKWTYCMKIIRIILLADY